MTILKDFSASPYEHRILCECKFLKTPESKGSLSERRVPCLELGTTAGSKCSSLIKPLHENWQQAKINISNCNPVTNFIWFVWDPQSENPNNCIKCWASYVALVNVIEKQILKSKTSGSSRPVCKLIKSQPRRCTWALAEAVMGHGHSETDSYGWKSCWKSCRKSCLKCFECFQSFGLNQIKNAQIQDALIISYTITYTYSKPLGDPSWMIVWVWVPEPVFGAGQPLDAPSKSLQKQGLGSNDDYFEAA